MKKKKLYLLPLIFISIVAITASCGGGGGGGGDGAPSGGGGGSSPTSVNLPETGQTACFDSNGFLITCTNTGQDGELRKGVVWPSPRFSANINGTVRDNLTGLIWLRNANCFSTRTWAQALTDANSLASGSCDLNDGSSAGDWRLPNRKELRSLINYSQADIASWLNAQGFSNVQAIGYWSSSTFTGTNSAYDVDMYRGGEVSTDKTNSNYVWPVRAGGGGAVADLPKTGQTTSYATGDDGDLKIGIAWPSPRFSFNINGTVTDNLTGLIWLKNANCFAALTWKDALNAANTLNSGECGLLDGSVEGDWRLPNVNELESLMNAEQADNAAWLNSQGFSNVQDFNWSSTTINDPPFNTNLAWIVSMSKWKVSSENKLNFRNVWPVRAGQ